MNNVNSTLHLLAKRLNPKYEFVHESHWYTVGGDNVDYYNECLICGIKYHGHLYEDFPEADMLIRQHGLFHLRERNLTAFL